MTLTRPIWAEVSQDKLARNYRRLRGLAGPDAELLSVIKADAYGHGLAQCARVLAAVGARWFGVTCVEEAAALRGMCPDARILSLSGLWPGEADAVIEHGLTPSVWTEAHLDLLGEAARRHGMRAGELPVHLEIDTGMSRQGAQLGELPALLERFRPPGPLRLEAAMTHFHSPHEPEANAGQMRAFAQAVERIVRAGLRPEFLSAGSSADVLEQSTAAVAELGRRLGARRMLRAGLGLYGYAPDGHPDAVLQPVLAWKTRITSLRWIEPGTTAGYGATYTARRRTRLALLPAGYADGLSRLLSNRGWVLVRGQRAPIAGRISMDQTMVDVTEIPDAAADDEVVLIGEQGRERITAQQIAELTGTITYEVLCAIAQRVPRTTVESPAPC
jgi:alanine racemase